jgi:hypothetical protein
MTNSELLGVANVRKLRFAWDAFIGIDDNVFPKILCRQNYRIALTIDDQTCEPVKSGSFYCNRC